MEKDDEIAGEGNSYTTEFRQYDPRVVRWLSLDPLMAKYPHQSPFSSFNNNPIYFMDPTGLEGVDQETANNGGGNIGDTYTDESGRVFGKTEIGWVEGKQEHKKPTFLQNIIGFITGVEKSMRGTAYWSFGIEFNTTDGKSNGQTTNPVAKEDFGSVLTIDNWNEYDEILDLVGLSQSRDAFDNPFATFNIYEPSGLQDYNIFKSFNKGNGKNNSREASNGFQQLKINVDAKNNSFVNPNPGSSVIGGFNVTGSSGPVLNNPDINQIKKSVFDSSGSIMSPDSIYRWGDWKDGKFIERGRYNMKNN